MVKDNVDDAGRARAPLAATIRPTESSASSRMTGRNSVRDRSTGEAPCHVATLDEAVQHALDDGAQGAVLLGEAFG
jgi:hypothetical protein